MTSSPHLNLLGNHIDVTRAPFSDRGSRLLVFQMPNQSRLMVRLAERLTYLQPGLDAYRRRSPLICDLCLVDKKGEILDFEVETFPHALYLNTRLGIFGLVFQDQYTLSFGLPPQAIAGLRFHVSPQFWEEMEQGGVFKRVRNLAYESNGEPFHNRIIPEEGGYIVEFIIQAGDDCAITLNIRNDADLNQNVKPFSTALAAAEERWHTWFDQAPSVDEQYRLTYSYAWWIMANNLISPQGSVTYEAMMPSKADYVGLWLWDNAMHALAYRHVDPELARNQLRAILACQLPDGMLPDAVYDEGIITEINHPIHGRVTKPPILAWAALKLHETDPDLNFLQEIYTPLVRWNAWWCSMNDDDWDGIVQYNHPYSSGLDDSPLWDYGMPVESPDLNTYLCIQMESLAMIAKELGLEAEVKMWRYRASVIVHRMIEDFWDEEAGIFRALHNEKPIPVLTPFNLYPLWTGRLPDTFCDRLIAHLTSPDEFWGVYAIPTVAYNDPNFDPETMWRGPVWVNVNYFFIEALRQVGRHDLARALLEKTLDLIMNQSGIHEYYNSKTGEPPPTAANTFGWTAAVFIDLAIQASRQDQGIYSQ